MKRYGFCIGVIWGLVPLAWAGGLIDNAVDQAISRLVQGDSSALVLTRYEDSSASALAFSRRAASLTDEDARRRVVVFAGELERLAVRRTEGLCHSPHGELAQEWAQIVQNDPADAVRGASAQNLRELFAPEVLDRYAAAIRQGVQRSRHREVFLLYGALPSNDSAAVQAWVRSCQDRQEIDRMGADAILARWGDREARGRLLAEADRLSEGGLAEVHRVFEALAYVADQEFRLTLARGLRSETMIELTGGGKLPKRNFYARALVRTMCDEPEFPVRSEDLLYSDEQLDQLEAWCARQWKVEFPPGPRKRLAAVPGIEPASPVVPSPEGSQ